MANFYLDVSAIGNEYQAYSATNTPTTWGVPEDGNGKAGPGHSAAVSIGTIDCASASCSGAGQLLVLGITVSSTLTGSGSTLATNIAAAINGSGTAVTSTYSALLLPINRLVYARVHPTINTTVQIMLRIAGADWNGMTHTTAGTWGTVPTMGAFAGGADGPFAYYVATSAVFGKAIAAYGLRVAKPAGVTDPNASADWIYTRCKRSGAALSCNLTITANTSLTVPTSRGFLYDSDGSTWSGDSGMFTLSVTSSSTYTLTVTTPDVTGVTMRDFAKTKNGFRFLYTQAGSGAATWTSLSQGANKTSAILQNVLFEESSSTSIIYLGNTGSGYVTSTFTNCDFLLKSSHYLAITAYYALILKVIGGTITYSGVSADVPYLVAVGEFKIYNDVTFSGVTVTTGGPVYQVASGVQSFAALSLPGPSQTFRFIECSGIRATSFSFPQTNGSAPKIGLWSSADPDREFRYEYQGCTGGTFITDWISDGTYPGLRTQLSSGVYQSIRVMWLTSITQYKSVIALTLSAFSQSTAAAKTVTVEFLATTNIATQGDVGMIVSYTSTDGTVYQETTVTPMSASLLSDSSVSGWQSPPVGSVSKKLVLVTANAVAQNSTVTIQIVLLGTPSSNTSFYFDPTPDIA